LQGQLPGERKQGLESDAHEGALRAILKGLYELVGWPVLKRLNESNIPEQPRVWWYPTPVFLFASTPRDGSDPIRRGPTTAFPRPIHSYAPPLSALIESGKLNPQTIEKSSMLLILRPDAVRCDRPSFDPRRHTLSHSLSPTLVFPALAPSSRPPRLQLFVFHLRRYTVDTFSLSVKPPLPSRPNPHGRRYADRPSSVGRRRKCSHLEIPSSFHVAHGVHGP